MVLAADDDGLEIAAAALMGWGAGSGIESAEGILSICQLSQVRTTIKFFFSFFLFLFCSFLFCHSSPCLWSLCLSLIFTFALFFVLAILRKQEQRKV